MLPTGRRFQGLRASDLDRLRDQPVAFAVSSQLFTFAAPTASSPFIRVTDATGWPLSSIGTALTARKPLLALTALATATASGSFADLAPLRIDDAERHQRDDARQDEQPARHQAAARAVHQPADISGQLLRLGTGQKHAVVERMQEPAFRHPPFFFDKNPVHYGDLPGRAAEAQRRDAKPDAKGFADRNAVTRLLLAVAAGQRKRIGQVRPPSCWWASCAFLRSRREPSDRRRHRA